MGAVERGRNDNEGYGERVKVSNDRMLRAAKAIDAACQDDNISDDAVYVYALMALIADDDGTVTEEQILDANRDPVLSSMAAGAVEVARHGNVL